MRSWWGLVGQEYFACWFISVLMYAAYFSNQLHIFFPSISSLLLCSNYGWMWKAHEVDCFDNKNNLSTKLVNKLIFFNVLSKEWRHLNNNTYISALILTQTIFTTKQQPLIKIIIVLTILQMSATTAENKSKISNSTVENYPDYAAIANRTFKDSVSAQQHTRPSSWNNRKNKFLMLNQKTD